MNKYFIFIIIILLAFIVWFLLIKKNELYEPENIVHIQPIHGLSNRIRVILGFLKSKSGSKLKVYWINDYTCNGNFTDIFEPIDNVEIIENPKNLPKMDYYGLEEYPVILERHNILYSLQEHKDIYKKLKLKKNLNDIVNNFIKVNNLENGISLHIRRTDHIELATMNKKFSEDEEFHDFINKFPKDTPIFLATDNKESQEKFMDRYKGRIFIYKKIEDNNNHRKTSLEDAAIDAFIASRIKNFKGSGYSSYSELIETLK
jgi:hypothetical protein